MRPAVSRPWQQDKVWSDRFLPELKQICGEHLISESANKDDAECNSDLVVLTIHGMRVACRVRKFAYLERYPDEFTIRASRPSDAKTELEKVIEGWGDYILYGFCDEREKKLAAWMLGDLKVFRGWFHSMVVRTGALPGSLQANRDNSSDFRAFRIDSLPRSFVIARKWDDPD